MEKDDLAKLIYALKVVITPDWDMQRLAREAVQAATHFAAAIEEKPGEPVLEPPPAAATPVIAPAEPTE